MRQRSRLSKKQPSCHMNETSHFDGIVSDISPIGKIMKMLSER